MIPTPPPDRLPDPRGCARREDLLALRLAALSALVGYLEGQLVSAPIARPTPLEDLSLRHLAKATGTTRSALALMREGCFTDACILTRAIFDQLFSYLWVVQDPLRAAARQVMVTIKQEWANAKYLEGLAVNAEPEARDDLLAESRRYREIAEALMARLASELGTTEKKVRDEATLRVSAKAIEVNLGPRFSVPYAHYSGFVHSDGNALAAYGTLGPDGMAYSIKGLPPAGVPLASDLHHVLLRLSSEVLARCPALRRPEAEALLSAHATWLAEVDAREQRREADPDALQDVVVLGEG